MNANPPDDAKGLLHVSLPRRVVLQDRGGVPTIYFGAEVIAFDVAHLAPLPMPWLRVNRLRRQRYVR